MTARQDTRAGAAAAAAPAPGPQRRHRDSMLARDRRFGYALVAAAVIVLLVITAYPLFYNIWNSLHHDVVTSGIPATWAGLSNYKEIFTDNLFVPSLVRTIGFTVVSVAVETVIGLGLAVALNRAFPGRGLVRAAVFIPWAVPTVVSAQLWKNMFDPQNGFVNYLLTELHLPLAHTTWLGQTWTAWGAILVADAWRNTPFVAIVLLAGLQVIPGDIYEAARIDGASAWQAFRRLTLPLLKPALMVAMIFRTLQSFLIFDVVYNMTAGGPGTSTSVLSYLNYQAFFVNFDYGYGGAISIALVVVALLIAAVYTRVFRVEQVL
ncbi:MAG: sugar ABC transporter permease [Actinobacteria bacterium]|nr:sugar ABC transporter permease [Actinomycetota bacterium]MBO0784468.1 sugar ABC transporter permease [Actinomycetota bacterium]